MLDLWVILAFVAYSVANGLRNRARASESLEAYFLAGRTLRGWRAGVSLAATQYAADTPLLVTGLVATGGVFLLWRLWIYGIGFLMIGYVLGRSWRRARVLTDAELTELRYAGRGAIVLRGLKAVYYGTVMNCTVLAMVLVAATRISEIFLPWHAWLPESLYGTLRRLVECVGVSITSGVTGLEPFTATTDNLISIALVLGFTALYATTGGLRSVVATDTVQFALAMLGTLLYAAVVAAHCGGLGGIVTRLEAIYGREAARGFLAWAPTGAEALAPFLVVVGLQWFFERNSDGTGYIAQRLLACRSDRDAQVAAAVFTWLQIVIRSLAWLVIAVGLLVVYPFDPASGGGEAFVSGRELTFAQGIQDLLGPGARGLMLVGLLAALASTVDTHLSWGSSYWSNDLYLRILNQSWLGRRPSAREQLAVARASNLGVLAIALGIMAVLPSIQTAWTVSLLFGAGTGAVLVLRWIWERINLWSEITAIAVSLALAPALLYSVEAEWSRMLIMASVSTLAVMAVSLATPPEPEAVRVRFYRRVDPPGFWSRTARAAGADPTRPQRALLTALARTAAMSAAVYGILFGCGRLLLPPPGASPWPAWAGLGIGAAVLASKVLRRAVVVRPGH